MKLVTYMFFLSILFGCATGHQLTPEAQNIEVVKSKPHGCVAVAKVKGIHKEGSLDLAKNMARNLAAKKGATKVYFSETYSNGSTWTAIAEAFQCN